MSKSLGLAIVFGAIAFAQPQYKITTVAGGSLPPTPAAALSTPITQPQRVAVDSKGNVFFTASNAVYEVTSSGTLILIAGTGRIGYAGDGGPATQAQFNNPQGIAVDGKGNIYVADTGNSLIRIITPDGNINLFAGYLNFGAPVAGWSGDGGSAVGARLQLPVGIALDGAGNLYVADSANNAIREISNGIITTIAGQGPTAPGFFGDGSSATGSNLDGPLDVAVDSSSNVYIADTNNANIRMITASSGNISTFAGATAVVSNVVTVKFGFSGDGGVATSAGLAGPAGVAVDSAGNVYIATYMDNRIRKVVKGTINTIAGNTGYGFAGDGGQALNAQLSAPRGIASDSAGNLYLADRWNNRIRKISSGTLTTIAGNGVANFGGDTGLATAAQMSAPNGVAIDNAGNIYVSDMLNNRVRLISSNGTISTYAGNGNSGYSGDGGAATAAQLSQPAGLAIDAAGNLYIADSNNSAVRKVTPGGTISTVAGTGTLGFSGDGGAATSAKMGAPFGVALDSSGNLYIADFYGWIRKVTASTGVITTIAGNGNIGYSGDGGPATSAVFYNPLAVAVDKTGNIYIADSNNGAVRMISNGTISTIAGNGALGYSGDGGSSLGAQFSQITGIVIDAQGNIYVADTGNNAIRIFPLNGNVSTIAGNGIQGYTGDTSFATFAEINNPTGVAVTPAGNIYFSDTGNNSVRQLTRQ